MVVPVAFISILLLHLEGAGATSVGLASGRSEDVVVATNPALLASVNRIAANSVLWRNAIESLRGTGRRVRIVTPDEVVVSDEKGRLTAFDPDVVAAASPVAPDGATVSQVLVVVNLELLQRLYWSSGAPPSDLQSDIDRVVVHEVYGHALPYLLAGDLSGRCADPAPSQPPSDACSIQRENAVRAELRLGRRTRSGMDGLALARRSLQ